jgi:large subunit ribosomal protein L32
MPLPKRRISKTRKRQRRTHWKLAMPGLSRCPKCDEVVAPHRVCPHCGFYKGRKVVETE